MLNSSKKFACFHQSKDDSEQRQNVWNSCSVAKTLNPKPMHMLQVGYIVGLGDRHSMNILLDQASAEVVHIDLGVAFEQGLMLKTPERVHLPHYTLMFWTYTLPLQAVLSIWNNAGGLNVLFYEKICFLMKFVVLFNTAHTHHVCQVPFRLTREIIDGMGVSGVEGIFRRCCEATLSVMRTNKEALLTIIEASSCVTKQDNFCNLWRNNSSSLCAAWRIRADVIVCYIFTGLHLWSFVQMGALTSQGLGTTAGVFKHSTIWFSMDSSL